MLVPSMRMSPLVSSISRLTSFSAVVLPPPDGPTSTQISPAGTVERQVVDGRRRRRRSASSPRRRRARRGSPPPASAICPTGPMRRYSSASRPTVKPGGSSVELLEREQDAVGERLARGRVVADRQQLPLAAEDHLLVRDEARAGAPSGSPGRRRSASRSRAAVPDGASFFASLCSSMISARGKYAPPAAAKRIISTAPIEKFGATKSRSPRSRASSSSGCGVPAGRADDARDALLERGAHVRRRGVGRREVDGRVEAAHVGLVADLDAAYLVARALEHGHERRPTLPSAPKNASFMPPRARRAPGSRARRRAEAILVRARRRTPRGRSGASSTAASSASCLGCRRRRSRRRSGRTSSARCRR